MQLFGEEVAVYMLDYMYIQKAIRDEIIADAENICENIKDEYLEKLEKEIEEKLNDLLIRKTIQIAQDIHFEFEKDVIENQTYVTLRIG